MVKKYIAILLGLVLFISILAFGINIFFSDSSEKEISVKVNDEEYKLPLGSTYEDLKELSGDISDDISDEAVLKNNDEIETSKKEGKISINTATLEELITLPGIGEKTALKIIEYRDTYGPFWTIEDLKNVKGIGDKKFEKLKEFISV